MFIRFIALVLIFAASAALAQAPTVVGTIDSPGHILQVVVTVNNEGRPAFSVMRAGTPVITESRLGFLLTDAPKLERNFKGAATATRSVDETWEQPWGE